MRKLGLVTAIGLAGLSLSGQVIALGLGEIEVRSFLNQPLEAEIEVISARPGEIDDLLVTLASPGPDYPVRVIFRTCVSKCKRVNPAIARLSLSLPSSL